MHAKQQSSIGDWERGAYGQRCPNQAHTLRIKAKAVRQQGSEAKQEMRRSKVLATKESKSD